MRVCKQIMKKEIGWQDFSFQAVFCFAQLGRAIMYWYRGRLVSPVEQLTMATGNTELE